MIFQSAANKHGATVSFHNIHYKVKQGGGCFGLKKASTKDILIDLKWVQMRVQKIASESNRRNFISNMKLLSLHLEKILKLKEKFKQEMIKSAHVH